MPQEPTDRELEQLFLSSDPAALDRLGELQKSPEAWGRVVKLCSAIAYGSRAGAGVDPRAPTLAPDRSTLERIRRRALAAFQNRFGAAASPFAAGYLPRLAAQSGPASSDAPFSGVGAERGVHALFVDPSHARAYIRPLFARLIESESFDVIPRVQCDSVMRAAATRAVGSALDVCEALGFSKSGVKGRAIEWWIDGPPARYEGASIGLAMALVTGALITGIAPDRETVVSGAVEGGRVLKVAGIAEKYRAVASHDFARLLMPADSRGDLPDAARSARSPRVVFVSTVRDALSATMGLALGLAENRLAAASPARGPALTLDLWVELAESPTKAAHRGISIDPVGPAKHWRIGDTLRVGLRASDDCHVALLNVGPTGDVSCLLPNSYRPDARTHAGEAFYFPGPQDGFRFTLNGPPGRERLIALATREPIHVSLPALTRLAAGSASDPADLLALLSSEVVLARATAEFVVDDAAPATRSLSRGTAAAPWRSYDL